MKCPKCNDFIILDRSQKQWRCLKCNLLKPFDFDKYLDFTEKQLKKLDSYDWYGIKQNNRLDAKTNFIYKVYGYNDLESFIYQAKLSDIERRYAKNRWYNFHSSIATEIIFSNSPLVTPNLNEKSKLVDFSIMDVKFDHKGTVFPKAYTKNFRDAVRDKKNLIEWFYKNQSVQGRYHLSNRLFIVFYSDNGEHWRLKAELHMIKNEIEKYLKNYNQKKLVKVELEPGRTSLSDIIFIKK